MFTVKFSSRRYPLATMELVEELAFGIVQEYRESQKDRLQRTFVAASDAATAKVNRLPTSSALGTRTPKLNPSS